MTWCIVDGEWESKTIGDGEKLFWSDRELKLILGDNFMIISKQSSGKYDSEVLFYLFIGLLRWIFRDWWLVDRSSVSFADEDFKDQVLFVFMGRVWAQPILLVSYDGGKFSSENFTKQIIFLFMGRVSAQQVLMVDRSIDLHWLIVGLCLTFKGFVSLVDSTPSISINLYYNIYQRNFNFK